MLLIFPTEVKGNSLLAQWLIVEGWAEQECVKLMFEAVGFEIS